MKTTYTCEICGNKSENKSEIKACERRGFNPKFPEKNTVEFLYTVIPGSHGFKVWLWGYILKIDIAIGTHELAYHMYVKGFIHQILFPESTKSAGLDSLLFELVILKGSELREWTGTTPDTFDLTRILEIERNKSKDELIHREVPPVYSRCSILPLSVKL